MAPPASKRRKLEHSSDNEDDDGSFTSFGAFEHEENGTAEDMQQGGMSVEEDEMDDVDGAAMSEDDEEDTEEDGEETVEEINVRDKAGTSKTSSRANPATAKDSGTLRKRLGDERAFTSGSFKSNTFKLQVDELLEQVRPRRGKREAAAEDSLHKLKTTIEQIPARSPLPVEDAEKQLRKKAQVVVPFPRPRPPKDAKYKLEYQKPANVNVVGSHALKTSSRATQVLEIDMALTMPPAIFQEKDFLNFRYFYKRAYYLACVAAEIKNGHSKDYDIRFASFRDKSLQPIVVVESLEKDAKTRWRINILACTPADVFSPDKLRLEKNSVRSLTASSDTIKQDQTQDSTPFYNSSLRADMLTTPYLKLLHNATKSCEAFQDACLLGSTWLRQRGISSDMHAGGFGNFEWSALMALLLTGGGPKGTPILSAGYSSYQLFKATLQVLAMKDFSKQPLVIGNSDYVHHPPSDGLPVVWDAERSHNILCRMATWAYKHLRQEAKTTLSTLGDQQYDGFDATFILRSDGLLYRYDSVIEVPLENDGGLKRDHLPFAQQQKLFKTLQKGLGDRASQINIIPAESQSWDISSHRSSDGSARILRIGLVVNAETVGRMVDHGPSPEQKAEAAAFQKFWGEKAELRRFKDGSILESLVWSAKDGGQSVLEQVVRYIVARHIGENVESGMRFFVDGVKRLMPHDAATAPFQALAEAYKQMESDIRGLEGLPLSIRHITAADGQLRSASLTPPATGPRPTPAVVVIQFEGSGRWPDDLIAIQRTKIAFLLKLSELLHDSVRTVTPRIGLENQEHDVLNQGYLDLVYDSGAAFRMRIYHDREQTLLERQLKDKALDPRFKEVAALGLAKHKRDYIKAPAHTQAVARLCSRHYPLSGTIRLVKKWFASHLLANHIADEVIELLVAKTFVQPWPWQTPSSVQTGFLRTLFFLSRWDWRAEPLIVDLSGSGDLKAADVQSITTKFEAWRKIDPALNRVVLFAASKVDHEGTTWTDGRPAKVVAGRMTALAKAACAEIKEKELALEPADLFSSPLSDFDFVLHLNPEILGKKKRKQSKANGAGFKNLEMELMGDTSLAGFEPIHDFLQELETLFGGAVLFFSGGHERPVVAGLWNPQTKGRAWKLNLAYSTLPEATATEEAVQAEVNKEGILAEMARLGGDMIERIDVNRS